MVMRYGICEVEDYLVPASWRWNLEMLARARGKDGHPRVLPGKYSVKHFCQAGSWKKVILIVLCFHNLTHYLQVLLSFLLLRRPRLLWTYDTS